MENGWQTNDQSYVRPHTNAACSCCCQPVGKSIQDSCRENSHNSIYTKILKRIMEKLTK